MGPLNCGEHPDFRAGALRCPTFLAAQGLFSEGAEAQENKARAAVPPAGKKYDMKKSINLWALPYPQKLTLKECFQLCKDAGFEGVEVNYALDGDLSPES